MDTRSHEGIIKPEPDKDYHGHPPYGKIYWVLMLFFVFSLGIGYLTSAYVSVVLIFILAIVKAWLVVANYMHLRFEPRLIWLVVGIVLFVVLMFYFGVYPDIALVKPEVAR